MEIKTQIFDKDGMIKINETIEGGDPVYFCFNFPCIPNIGDEVKIYDTDISGDYIVVEPAFYEVSKGIAYPILFLKEKPFDTETRNAIAN